MRRYLAGPRGKPAAVGSSVAIQRQSKTVRAGQILEKKKIAMRALRRGSEAAVRSTQLLPAAVFGLARSGCGGGSDGGGGVRTCCPYGQHRCHTSGVDAPCRPGAVFDLSRTFSAADVRSFAAVSGDANPLHREGNVAAESRFEQPVVHGMLIASLFSAIIGNAFPGSIYLSQTLRFVAPVPVGSTVTARVTVLKIKKLNGATVASMSTAVALRAADAGGRETPVLEGQALCQLPADAA